jgi:NADH:ubiquinone oxidoreductase subunit 6 (subunit J)
LVVRRAIALAAFGVIAGAIVTSTASTPRAAAARTVTVREIGDKLMRDYVLPLEIVGLLLTAAMIARVVIAMQERKKS